jgi:hypothetical protein
MGSMTIQEQRRRGAGEQLQQNSKMRCFLSLMTVFAKLARPAM